MNTTHYRNTLVAAAVAATLGVSAAGCSNSPDDYSSTAESSSTAGQPLSDTAITTQVKARLASEVSRSGDINVSTVNGVVTLEGSVNDAAASSAAERAARSVSGVASVNNRLSTPSSTMAAMREGADTARDAVSDSWITTKVKSSLLADSEAKGFDVSVETNNGVVTLQGALESQAAVDHVREIAAGVEGVRSVNTTALTVDGQR